VPSIVLLVAAGLHGAYGISRAQGRTQLTSLGVAAACAALPILLVSWQNYRSYQWFGTVEFRSPEFNDAYGAMVRVKIGPELAFVPVTRQARAAMYQVSPTFAKLQPFLEGDAGLGWAGASAGMTKLAPEERQIGGGWLVWALRDTVAAAGYCHNAREALDFYRRTADEINRACDDGRLPAHPARSGFMPVWKEGQTAEVLQTAWMFADFVAGYKSFSAYPHLSTGTDDEVRLFRDLTRDNLSVVPNATNFILPNQISLDGWKVGVLEETGKFLRRPLLILFLAAHALVLVRLVQLAWTRELSFPLVLAAAAWGAAFAYLLINAVVQVTSFGVIAVSTFWPVYPLLQLFSVAAVWDAAAAWLAAPPDTRPAA
jgi:hypothetical protein